MNAKILLVAFGLLMPAAATAAETPGAAEKPARTTAAKPQEATQQSRMARCSGDAKSRSLKGDARKEFMRECLKTTPAERTARRECGASAKDKGLKGAARKSFVEECMKVRISQNTN